MTWMISALAFIVLLTGLVLIHEFGHYLLARIVGVDVEEFGFGLPPAMMKLFRWKGTWFTLNWIPFGGFVRLRGETSMDDVERMQEGSFAAAPVLAKFSILIAGVFMNFLLSFILFTLGFWLWSWIPTYFNVEDVRLASERGELQVEWGLYISDVIPGSPADQTGDLEGAVLIEVDGQRVTTVNEVLEMQEGKRSVVYTLLSGPELAEQTTTTVAVTQGKTGIAVSEFVIKVLSARRSIVTAVVLSLRETWAATVGTVKGMTGLIVSLVKERVVPPGITGVVGIAQMTHDSLKEGMMVYLRLVALLSLSLAVLNTLPFPALDGGRLVFVLYEFVTGSHFNRKVEVIINSVGLLLIMLLMALVTWNDIVILFEHPSL